MTSATQVTSAGCSLWLASCHGDTTVPSCRPARALGARWDGSAHAGRRTVGPTPADLDGQFAHDERAPHRRSWRPPPVAQPGDGDLLQLDTSNGVCVATIGAPPLNVMTTDLFAELAVVRRRRGGRRRRPGRRAQVRRPRVLHRAFRRRGIDRRADRRSASAPGSSRSLPPDVRALPDDAEGHHLRDRRASSAAPTSSTSSRPEVGGANSLPPAPIGPVRGRVRRPRVPFGMEMRGHG